MQLLQEKRDTKKLQKTYKLLLVVTNKHPENQDVFSSSKLSAGMKTYVGTIRFKGKKKSYIIDDNNLNKIRINVVIHIGSNDITNLITTTLMQKG